MTTARYSQYQDSGVEWLSHVPSHWTLRRLGFYFEERREKVSDADFPALSVTKNGIVPQLETAAKTDDGDNRKRVAAGDFVINSRSDRKGSSGVSELDGSVSLINTVLILRDEVHPRFVHHLLRSAVFQEEYYRFGRGIVADLWSTSYGEMRNILLAVPPPAEQAAIATFLDRETANIDALVEEQKRLIELLKEKRQAVISQAVTKGLDPNVPMEDSGLEWLGEVPAHWDVLRVKAVSTFVTSGPRGWSEYLSEDGALFVQSGDLTETLGIDFANAKRVNVVDDAEAKRTQLRIGDVLVCITGAKTGKVAVCEDLDELAFINQHICLIRPTEEFQPAYLGAYLHSVAGQRYFELAQYGLKQGLSLENVKNAAVPVPPRPEQDQIVDFIRRFAVESDDLTAVAETLITLLHERRSVLISAAVTGKIDVRGLAHQREDAAA